MYIYAYKIYIIHNIYICIYIHRGGTCHSQKATQDGIFFRLTGTTATISTRHPSISKIHHLGLFAHFFKSVFDCCNLSPVVAGPPSEQSPLHLCRARRRHLLLVDGRPAQHPPPENTAEQSSAKCKHLISPSPASPAWRRNTVHPPIWQMRAPCVLITCELRGVRGPSNSSAAVQPRRTSAGMRDWSPRTIC